MCFLVSFIICSWYIQNVCTDLKWMSGYALPFPLAEYAIGFDSNNQNVYLFGGHNGTAYSHNILKWNANQPGSDWTIITEKTPTKIIFQGRSSSVTINNLVYFVGLYNGTYDNGKVYLFNLTNERFIIDNGIPNMPIPSIFGCVATNGQLIFVGGGAKSANVSGPVLIDQLQIFNISSNEWLDTYSLPYPVWQSVCDVDTANDILYFFGGDGGPSNGATGTPIYQSFMYYNISQPQNVWQYVQLNATLISPHVVGYAVYSREHQNIYLLGGHNTTHIIATGNVEVFDTVSKTLSVDNDLFRPSNAMCALIIMDRIMIFGGDSNGMRTDIIQTTNLYPSQFRLLNIELPVSCHRKCIMVNDELNENIVIIVDNVQYTISNVNLTLNNYSWTIKNDLYLPFNATEVFYYSQGFAYVNRKIYGFGLSAPKLTTSLFIYDMDIHDYVSGNLYNHSLPYAVTVGCVTSDSNNVYAIGGRYILSKLQIYSILNDEWSLGSSLNVGRYYCGVSSINDESLFVFGGAMFFDNDTDTDIFLDSIEKYDIMQDKWHLLNNKFMIARWRHNCAFLNGYIYCVGGQNGLQWLKSTEIFDVGKETVITDLYPYIYLNQGNVVQPKLISIDNQYMVMMSGDSPRLKFEIMSALDTFSPTTNPTIEPTTNPIFDPTVNPTTIPSNQPTYYPTTYYPTYNPTIEPATNPTIYPTNHPTYYPTYNPTTIPSNQPTNDPTYAPTGLPTHDPTVTVIPTTQPTIDPTYGSTYITTEQQISDSISSIQTNSLLFSIMAILGCMDLILIIFCLVYIMKKLRLRSEKPGNVSYIDAIKEFGILQYIQIITEIFDITTDYLYAASLIVTDDNDLIILGWLSLLFSISGLSIFFFKYSTYRKLIALQVKTLRDKLRTCSDDDKRDIIIKEIRHRTMDITIISLLNGCIEDVPQTIIILIATSNIKWNYVSILTISFSIISFTSKLSNVIVTKLGCMDEPTTQNETNKRQLQMIQQNTPMDSD
eukprot:433549_1